MKTLIINDKNIKEEEIDRTVIRAKALIINSKDECLVGLSNNCYQFIGGHLEYNELLEECLIREIEEESGIKLSLENRKPYFIKIFSLKDYPNKGINSKYISNYFVINTDIKPDINNINLTLQEKEGLFKFKYIKIEELKNILELELQKEKYESKCNVIRDTYDALYAYEQKNKKRVDK